jgi:hypothetical protein
MMAVRPTRYVALQKSRLLQSGYTVVVRVAAAPARWWRSVMTTGKPAHKAGLNPMPGGLYGRDRMSL